MNDLPTRTLVVGYIYAIQFSTGVTKVGRTSDPWTRYDQHRSAAETFGVSITRHWVSPLHNRFERTERRLVETALELSTGQIRTEYFLGIDFDELLAEVAQMFDDFAHLILPASVQPSARPVPTHSPQADRRYRRARVA